MYLVKLYSEPDGLFPTTEFGNGISFIYAKKDQPTDVKKSLNGLGKSLFVNLIDFCLLSSSTPHIQSAIKNNKVEDYLIALEFEIDEVNYVIKRPLINSNQNIQFGEKNKELKNFSNTKNNKELSETLCDLIFKRSSYKGVYSNKWLRQLIPFYIKKQSSSKKVNFLDPIEYLQGSSEMSLIPLHLFLLNVNNRIFTENLQVSKKIKEIKPAIKEVELLVKNKYKVDDVVEVEGTLQRLKQQISIFEKNIKNFELADQYRDAEEEANQLTRTIKELLLNNISDKDKIDLYEESYQYKDNINAKTIEKIYREFNEIIADKVKKTLDDAISFRKKISKSREEFLQSEIDLLKSKVDERKELIKKYESQRASLLGILDSKEAISDITEAYLILSKKRENFSDLNSQIKTLKDLNSELASYLTSSSKIYEEILTISESIDGELEKFRQTFFEIHDEIYTEFQGEASMVFRPNDKKDSKIDFDISLPKKLSKGKNQARTLIYDLSILMNSIRQNLKSPKFLIHDGIFDGMDKAHFIHLFKYLEKQKNSGLRFQYIVTLNQEGTIKDIDFGKGAEEITSNKIDDHSNIILTPAKPLFGKHWG